MSRIEARCDCGNSTALICRDFYEQLLGIPCTKPRCHKSCPHHRHAPGSMGFIGAMKASAAFQGFVPDGPGFVEWFKDLWRRWTYSPAAIARYVWAREVLSTPPPTPLPTELMLTVGYYRFRCSRVDGIDRIVRVN